MKRFVVVGWGRSGTTYVMHLLKGHPSVYLSPMMGDFCELLPSNWSGSTVNSMSQHVIEVYQEQSTQVVGSKCPFVYGEQVVPEYVWDILHELDVQVIHVFRENLLRRLVSNKIASKQETWIYLPRHKELPQPTVVVDTFELNAEIAKGWAPSRQSLRLLVGRPYLAVSYERLLVDPQKEYDRMCRFLELQLIALPEVVVKQQQRLPLNEAIGNYSDLKEVFAFSDAARFFDEE